MQNTVEGLRRSYNDSGLSYFDIGVHYIYSINYPLRLRRQTLTLMGAKIRFLEDITL